jgi:hypothetical protein
MKFFPIVIQLIFYGIRLNFDSFFGFQFILWQINLFPIKTSLNYSATASDNYEETINGHNNCVHKLIDRRKQQ